MDQRAMHVMEVTKEERKYYFHMPLHAPIGEAYDALFECLNEILEQSKRAVEASKRQEEKAEETPAE